MNRFVTDTMALILRLEKRKLPEQVKSIFKNAEKGKTQIIIPSLVFAEIAYLSEKRKIETNLTLTNKYMQSHKNIVEHKLSFEIIANSFDIADIPELHDKLIAGTAFHLTEKLITNDPIIRASKFVKTIWK